jgi:hypothetical protein
MKRSGFEVGSAKKNCHVRDSYKASSELINARVSGCESSVKSWR